MAAKNTDGDMPKFMVGTCMGMCPNAEIRLRQKEELIHVLEKARNARGDVMGYANPRYMVKEFSRSAAGRETIPSDIRPYPVLAKTVKFLLTNSCCRTDVTWTQIYDFVNDRLRAVRQDMCIQGLKKVDYVLLASVRFYVYAHYRMCEYELADFDPYLNKKTLSETLALILSTYRDTDEDSDESSMRNDYVDPYIESDPEIEQEESQESEEKIRNDSETNEKTSSGENSGSDIVTDMRNLNMEENSNSISSDSMHNSSETPHRRQCENPMNLTSREEAVALYILVNFGNEAALGHALELPKSVRSSPLVSLVIEMSEAWLINNYSSVLRLSTQLPPLFLCCFHQHLALIERTALAVLSRSHSCKGQFYSKEDLAKLLFFSNFESMAQACQHYGIAVSDSGISFNKASFKADVPLRKLTKLKWIDESVNRIPLAELLIPPHAEPF